MDSGKVAGRLAYLVNIWKVLTKVTWVFNAIEGYQIPLIGNPLQHQRPPESVFSGSSSARGSRFPSAEGSHLSCHRGHRGFLLNNIPGAQKEWSNETYNQLEVSQSVGGGPTFQNGGQCYHERPGDWMVQVDLKDAYFTIPIHLHHQQFMRFRVERLCYQFTCLLFGLSCAPWTFTKVIKPLMTLLRTWGIRIIVYIDDMLILAKTREETSQHLEVFRFLLETLGFTVNRDKSYLDPAQELKFLGLLVDSQSLQLRLPGEMIKHMRKEATQFLVRESISAHQLSQFLGKLNEVSQAMLVATLFIEPCRRIARQLWYRELRTTRIW